MSNPMQDARYAPPQVEVDDVEPETDGVPLATRKRRLSAILMDVVLQVGALWIISVVTPYDPWATTGLESIWLNSLTQMGVGVLIFLLLNAYLLLSRGQTIGKAITGIKITRPSGEAASPKQLALRYGVGYIAAIIPVVIWVYSLVDSLMIFRKSRRCLHDDIAGTVVIKI